MSTVASNPDNIIAIVLLPIAGLVIAVCFAVLCFQWLNSSKDAKPLYERVSGNKQKCLTEVKVLLIWTKYHSPNAPDPEPLVVALKKFLKTYCVVQIYDYMDPTSMPRDQCRMLYSDPTSWLSQKLRQVDFKIIIVASEGAAYRKSLSETDHNFNDTQELLSQMDQNLFPHALRYLKEFRNLSLDYSRVFQVCFPDVYGSNIELDDLVPSARFNMPHHLNELARRLHGFKEDYYTFFNSSNDQEGDFLTEAIKFLEK